MTTVTTPATTPSTVSRRARAATVGAVLWTLSSGIWAISEMEDQEFGSLRFVAVAVAWWVFMVLPAALLILGHAALRTALGPAAGRVGSVGLVVAAAGIGALGLGIGIEVASMSVGGGEVALGHVILLVGYLVSVVGALLLGIMIIRRRRDGLSRAAGWLLVLAVPLGIGIGLLGSAVAPENDAVFWAALTVPTGIAWVLLGASLRPVVRPAPAEFTTAD
ncbi:hypothetical protein [Blastococcus sp. CT_GayMR16]|uniref:hypothetical protein n=1 Tax=Blastococcus sp. CT_GayMR16 TaxID=2559607 RepID=UPI0010736650|nr:hypothetical protein [Blastococcus sp. CT_GayMR16]TFV89844.1 hypothetical protein E4P38_05145 [Blastococcus sp. CT_GayMR16]